MLQYTSLAKEKSLEMSGQQNKANKDDKSKKSGDNNNNKEDDKKPVAQKPVTLYIKHPGYVAPDPYGLAPTPKDKIVLRPGQPHPLILNRDHPATKRPEKNAEHFQKRGAAEKPADGPNTKAANKRCLTCIQQGGVCHGTDVEGGRCRACRGIPVNPGKSRRSRKCYWLETNNNIFTYAEAKRVYEGTRIPINERAVVPAPPAPEEANAVLNAPGLFDIDPESGDLETLTELVGRLWDTRRFTTNGDVNLVTIRDAARSQYQQLAITMSPEELAASHTANHLRTIITAAEAMMRREAPDEVLVPLALLHLLPEGHPGRNYGTRAAGRGMPGDL